MSFRLVKFYAVFIAGLLPGISLLAQTNSIQAEQPIIFSSPDGETVSNALLPVIQSPASSRFADMPSEVPESIAFPHPPVRKLYGSARMPTRQKNTQSLLDEDGTGLSTPSQIMGVPTLADIFGLPKPYATYTQKKNKDKDAQNPQDTEDPDNASPEDGSPTNSNSAEANWMKILSGNVDQSAFAPDKPKSPRVSTGFFDSTPTTDASGKSLQEKYQALDATVFGSSPFDQTPVDQSALNQSAQASQTIAPVSIPASAPAISPSVSSFDSAFSQGLNSQSPFALPQSASLGMLPQLPALPVTTFQNNVAPPAAAPSWAPKPPPWLSQTPAFGGIGQGKF
jgi:hypothetical protein